MCRAGTLALFVLSLLVYSTAGAQEQRIPYKIWGAPWFYPNYPDAHLEGTPADAVDGKLDTALTVVMTREAGVSAPDLRVLLMPVDATISGKLKRIVVTMRVGHGFVREEVISLVGVGGYSHIELFRGTIYDGMQLTWTPPGQFDLAGLTRFEVYLDPTAYHDVGALNNPTGFAEIAVIGEVSAPPTAEPSVSIEVVDADNVPLVAGQALGLTTSDGWPTPNSLTVRVTASCPVGGNCHALPVRLSLGSEIGVGRFYMESDEPQVCNHVSPTPDNYSYSNYSWSCSLADGPNDLVPPGQSRTFTWRLFVQPSQATSMDFTAAFGPTAQTTRSHAVQAADIHPLLFVHGILGSMPPSETLGQLDPVIGSYRPLLTQLQKMGYEDGITLHQVSYDWRKSNIHSAAHLSMKIRDGLERAKAVTYASGSGTGTVDLVVHSMGGLVARSYVQGMAKPENGVDIPYNYDVRKIVFISTPHRGFPETYKTYEGTDWSDYLYQYPLQQIALNNIFWPQFTLKRWMARHPLQVPPLHCTGLTECLQDVYAMVHDVVGGADSLREMLPTDDVEPYLCANSADGVCTNAYPSGQPHNPLLNGLNASVGELANRLGGASNLYLIYGKNPSPEHNTDFAYNVGSPGIGGWKEGKPEQIFKTPSGDDLIPEYSLDLRRLLPQIPDANVAGFKIVNGVPSTGLEGDDARHKQIVWHSEVQKHYIPSFLTGLASVPFITEYKEPLFLIDPQQWLTLTGLCPVNLMIKDPNGNITGYDPTNPAGPALNPIPNAMYSGAGVESQFIIIPNPIPGNYEVTATGFGSGPFTLTLNQVRPEGTSQRWVGEGVTQLGQISRFTFTVSSLGPITQGPPVAHAGQDQSVVAGEQLYADVQLDGSGSSDPDGEALLHFWSGPFGAATGVAPHVSIPPGTHEITLTVVDGQGAASTDTVTVAVGQSVKGTSVSLTASPRRLSPADGRMVPVTITSAGAAHCRIVEVSSDEPNDGLGTPVDWRITGRLSVKLRAERSKHRNGRQYTIEVKCRTAAGDTVLKRVHVNVPKPKT